MTHFKEFIITYVNKCNGYGYVILNSISIQNDVLIDGFVSLNIEVKINYKFFYRLIFFDLYIIDCTHLD